MPKTYTVSKEQAEEIAKIRKSIKDVRTDRRLHAVQLRGEGMKNPAIAAKLDTASKVVSRWVSSFCNDGIESILGGNFGGNRRNIAYEEEKALLDDFKEKAELGQIVEVKEIKAAYEGKVGHTIGKSQIYRVLKRHGWRKLLPRSKHPNKASEAEIEASKKLKKHSEN